MSPNLATNLLFDIRHWLYQYLNWCVTESKLKDFSAPIATVPFYLEPIIQDMKGVWYVGTILPTAMEDLVNGWWRSQHPPGGIGTGGGGKLSIFTRAKGRRSGMESVWIRTCAGRNGNRVTGFVAREKLIYKTHLASLSLLGG